MAMQNGPTRLKKINAIYPHHQFPESGRSGGATPHPSYEPLLHQRVQLRSAHVRRQRDALQKLGGQNLEPNFHNLIDITDNRLWQKYASIVAKRC